MNTVAKRNNISFVRVRTRLHTSYLTTTQAMFDNISVSSIHLARDATRKMNIYHSDYADMIDDIEYNIYTDYGDFPSISEKSRAIYDYLRDYSNTHDTDSFIDLELIQLIQDELELPSDCQEQSIVASALGRVFGIKTRIVQIDIDGEAGDHFISEYYWSSEWHVLDTKLGFFDDEEGLREYYEEEYITDVNILLDYLQAAEPRDGNDLKEDVVVYIVYNGHPYN